MQTTLDHMNVIGGWWLIVIGLVSGFGLMPVFLKDSLLGGYDSFRRRFLRLSHIAFVVLGCINVMSGITIAAPNHLLLIGGAGMATGCLLAAVKEWFKYILPVFAVMLIWGCINVLLAKNGYALTP